MQELVQLIAMLSSLSDFGVAPNPKAAPPAELTRYGMDDADLFVYFDAEAVVPRNVNAFIALADKPGLKDAPELRAQIAEAVGKLQMGRAGAKLATGVDPVSDVKSVALWAKLDGSEPVVVIAARGNFPTDVSALGAAAQMEVGRTSDGQLLVTSPGMLQPRVTKGWKRLRRDEAASLAGKPFFALHARPSPAALERLRTLNREADTFIGTSGASMVQAFVAVRHDGVTWSYQASNRTSYDTAVLASDAILHLLRSAHLFGRGIARLLIAGARGFGSPAMSAAVMAHEKELLALADSWSGDGRFVAVIDRAPAKNTVTVRASGKKLSHVLPLAGLLPLVGAFAYLGAHKGAMPPAAEAAAEAAPARAPAGRPLDVGGAYRRARAKRGAR